MRGDMDGDGKPDRIVVHGSSVAITKGSVDIYRSNGRHQHVSFGDASLASLLGLYDVNHDGTLDAFVNTIQGANTSRVEIIGFVRKRFRVFRGTNSHAFTIMSGGAAYHANGFVCGGSDERPVITLVGVDAYGAKPGWEWTKTSYVVHGDTLTRMSGTTGFVSGSISSGPPREYMPGPDCGRLTQYRD